jgi:hypothetical protein
MESQSQIITALQHWTIRKIQRRKTHQRGYYKQDKITEDRERTTG